jgi:hypothetical protein
MCSDYYQLRSASEPWRLRNVLRFSQRPIEPAYLRGRAFRRTLICVPNKHKYLWVNYTKLLISLEP